MSRENLKNYIREVSCLLKDNARRANLEADTSAEGDSDYNTGYLMAYHEVIAIMKSGPFF